MDEKHHFPKRSSTVRLPVDFYSPKKSVEGPQEKNAVIHNINTLRFDTSGSADIFLTFELYIVKAA